MILEMLPAAGTDSASKKAFPMPQETRRADRNTSTMLLVAVSVVTAVGLLAWFSRPEPDSPAGGIGKSHAATGAKYTGLHLEPLVGAPQPVTIDQLSGKVVLLNFWGPWCMYCRVEIPELVALNNELKDRADYQFLSISCSGGADLESNQHRLRDDTADYLRETGYDFAVYWDPESRARRALMDATRQPDGRVGYPTTVVLDREGVIRGVWPGYSTSVVKEMTDLIHELLREAARPAEAADVAETG
jgi:thiol-disulfide isomerase/thioredoxin